jgi:hypothetical protein
MRAKLSIQLCIIWGTATTGCGPMFLPISPRLGPEDQHQVDTIWDNMMTPVNRVGRDTLLDTLMVYWLYQTGVDRLHLVSEKYLTHGKVMMEIDCDRSSPDTHQFTLTVLDGRGRTLRRERYARCEIEQSAKALWEFDPNSIAQNMQRFTDHSTTRPTTEPIISPTSERDNLERDRRLKAIEAATRPAKVDSSR